MKKLLGIILVTLVLGIILIMPTILNGQNGGTNYIQFNYTTTDNPIDFKMELHFFWYPLFDGSRLTLVE